MALEERVLRTCQECAMTHIDDIEAALRAAKRQLKLPKLPDWIAELVEYALREQIHFARHVSNRKLRKAAGGYGGPAKIGTSDWLNSVAESVWQQSVFSHTIGGFRFGAIEKEELLYFAEVEDEKAKGSVFNAELCRQAAAICAKRRGATVEECMSESQAAKIFQNIAKQLGRDVA